MTKQEILANATARPWVPSETEGDIVIGDSRELCATAYDMKNRATEGDANRDLILLAVNTYEEREALIGKLTEALRTIEQESSDDRAVDVAQAALVIARQREVQP